MTGPPGRARGALAWVGASAALFLMAAGWALGLPVDGTYDESQHAIRAYAAASGQLYARHDALTGARFEVPRSLLPPNFTCTWQSGRRPATCQQPATSDRTRVPTRTAAGRYNPVYYALVGLPEVLRPNPTGIIWARLVSGLFSALLLGAAAAIAWTSRRPLLLAAIVLAVTPMTLDLAGSVNPNGLEISAGLLCWTALLVLLRRDGGAVPSEPGPTDRTLIWCAGVSAALLLTLRTLGPLFLAMTAVAALALARPGRVRSLLSQRATRVAVAALAVVAAYAVAWTVLAGQLAVTPTTTGSADSAAQTLRLIVAQRMDFWAQQVVGVFSYGETALPRWIYLVWYALGGALVVPAVLLARRRDGLTLAAIGVASVAVLTGLEVHYIRVLGLSQHGRYVMPFAVGLLLGAALVPQWQRVLDGPPARRLTLAFLLLTAPLQVYALGAVMSRFERGVGASWQPFGGGWRPAWGAGAPLAAEVVGLLLWALFVLTCPAGGTSPVPEVDLPAGSVAAGLGGGRPS